MKVLQVISSLDVGGAEKVCVMLANSLQRNSVENALLIITSNADLISEVNSDVKIFKLNRKSRFDLETFREFKKIADNFDIVHAHLRDAYKYSRFVRFLSGLKPKIIFHDHFGNITKPEWWLRFPFKPDYYIGIHSGLKNWAEKELKITPENAFILENTVSRFEQSAAEIENKRGLVIVSNFVESKNIEFAISLAEKTNLQLDIFGQVRDREYFDKIKSIIQSKNLNDRIRIVTSEKNIRDKISGYKLALHTSKFESGPLTLIEYLSSGLPFVSFNTGQVVTQIKSELPEFIADTFDENIWIDKINYMLKNQNNQDLKNKMKNIYENIFSENIYFKKCLNIYSSVLNS